MKTKRHALADRREIVGHASGSRNPNEPINDLEHDPVLIAAWNHRGTVEAAAVLNGGGGGRVKRRVFLSRTGSALTAPAHQRLVHEPEPLVSELAGRRVSGEFGRLAPGHNRGAAGNG